MVKFMLNKALTFLYAFSQSQHRHSRMREEVRTDYIEFLVKDVTSLVA